ncbi:hypothetical protein C0995_011683 [Termitomyces sp. Mi166|nr:hypothetical protein C0995_011683 [Termitomyces sp. Mi166\
MLISKVIYASLAALAYFGGLDVFSDTHQELLGYSMLLIVALEVGEVINIACESAFSQKMEPVLTIEGVLPPPPICINRMGSLHMSMPTTCPARPAPFPADKSPAFIYFTAPTCAPHERPVPSPAPAPIPAIIPQLQMCRFDWTSTLSKPMPNTCVAGSAPISVSPSWIYPAIFDVDELMTCAVHELPGPDPTPARTETAQNVTSSKPASRVAISFAYDPTPNLPFVVILITIWALIVWLLAVQRLAYDRKDKVTFDGELFPEPTFDPVVLNVFDMALGNHEDAVDHQGFIIPEIIITDTDNPVDTIATKSEAEKTQVVYFLACAVTSLAISEAEKTQVLHLVTDSLLAAVLPPSDEVPDTHATDEDIRLDKIEKLFCMVLAGEELDINSEFFIDEYHQELSDHLEAMYPDPEVVMPAEFPAMWAAPTVEKPLSDAPVGDFLQVPTFDRNFERVYPCAISDEESSLEAIGRVAARVLTIVTIVLGIGLMTFGDRSYDDLPLLLRISFPALPHLFVLFFA